MEKDLRKKILTRREKDVLVLIVKGYSNQQMAEELIVSIHTIKAHIESIYRKLNVHNRVQATLYVVNNNVIER